MRVLVIVASPHRGTSFLADGLGDQFTSRGVEADVIGADEMGDLDPYDAVVVGAALSGGQFRRDARTFVRTHSAALSDRPVWLFSTNPAKAGARDRVVDVDLGAIIRAIGVHEHRVFDVPSNRELRRAERRDESIGKIRWHELGEWAEDIIDRLTIHRMWMTGQIVTGPEAAERSSPR